MRQWVVSLPHRLRYLLAWDHKLCRAVLGVAVRAVLGFYRRRARCAGVPDGRSGAVTVIQRFGGGLQLNVHFHSLVLDGVFVEAADEAADVLQKILRHLGLPTDPPAVPPARPPPSMPDLFPDSPA